LGLSLDITERKRSDERAERARQEARRLAMVAEKTDNAVVITDAVGRIEWLNAGFSEITGWSLDQAMGRKPGEFLQGPETSEAHRAALTKAISNADALTTEIVNYHADGHPYWIEIDMQPVLGDDGAPAHFISIQRDVSRRKAQDALAQARSDVFERIAAGADQADVLEALARALGNGAIGMTASILVRDEAGERLHVAAAPGLPRRYRDALNGLAIGPRVVGCGTAAFNAERCVAEDIFAHPNWRDHETLANLSGMRACWSQPVQSEDGKVQGVLELYAPRSRAPGQWEIELIEQAAALCANVLTRFEVIAAENASHRRLASMAEAVPVPVVYLGRDTVVKYANAAYASYHNTERDKLVGKSVPEIVGAKAWAVIERPFRDALTGKRQYFEARLEYRPDMVLDVRINLVPEFARDGSVTGVYKVPENLTEFRRRERELRSAYEAAENANKVKSNFLANMSHELRTPLNAILGYTDIMKQQMFGPLGSERYVDYINDIHASGSYLHDLLQDVLDLARLDAGGRELAYDRVDLHEAIEDAVRIQGQRKADVRVRHCDPLPVLADERALKQVLVNVVDNALKYGGEKGVDIDVAQPTVDTVSVTVSDFGPGIAPDDLAHVTEPFYTGQRSAMVARQSTEGTGVGLALSKRLSEAMGGSLTIESEVGQGTNVTISLPLPPEPTEPAL
jgi:PAS domain S-box-containing protein